MKNAEAWKPTKFNIDNGKLTASTDTAYVHAGSWLIVDIIASFYQENISKHARGSLIDLGCGNVPLYASYKDFVEKIVCVDWQHSVHGVSYLDFECDLNKRLPFGNAEFDTVILSDVLEHVADPAHLWMEIARMLRLNGKLLMNVPFYYGIHERPYDYYRYTEYALKRFAELAGLNIILLKPMGGSLEILTDLVAKHLEPVPIVGMFFSKLISRVVRAFHKTALGNRLSIKTGHWFPLGYFLIAEKAELP